MNFETIKTINGWKICSTVKGLKPLEARAWNLLPSNRKFHPRRNLVLGCSIQSQIQTSHPCRLWEAQRCIQSANEKSPFCRKKSMCVVTEFITPGRRVARDLDTRKYSPHFAIIHMRMDRLRMQIFFLF
jgi:hypothetical protein